MDDKTSLRSMVCAFAKRMELGEEITFPVEFSEMFRLTIMGQPLTRTQLAGCIMAVSRLLGADSECGRFLAALWAKGSGSLTVSEDAMDEVWEVAKAVGIANRQRHVWSRGPRDGRRRSAA